MSAAAILLLAGGGWAAYATDVFRTHPARAATPAIATGTAPVVRTDVRQQAVVTGTLTYAGTYEVIASGGAGQGSAAEVITWLPSVGQVVSRGQRLYEVNGQLVPLFYGARPAWRDMEIGMTDGPDVRQLKRNLIALGYGPGLVADDTFDLATVQAVEAWQQAVGLPVTGTVPVGEVAFLPGPILVGQQAAPVGAPVPAGTPIITGTSTTPDVELQLDPSVAPSIRPGNSVLVTLPDGRTVAGVVGQVSKVAAAQPQGQQGQQGQGQPGQQQALVPVTVRLLGPAGGTLDQAPVQVTITSAQDTNVLAVPVTALLAQPGGQFTVVVVSGGSRHTVPVQTGLFDETAGDVEVTGAGLAAGQRVEVPSQ